MFLHFCRNLDDQCKLITMNNEELIKFVHKKQLEKFLPMQQKKILTKFGGELELSFERKFLWG